MRNGPTRLGGTALALIAAGTLAGCLREDEGSLTAPQLGVLHSGDHAAGAFAIYTQNVYLGGDTGPLFTIGDFSDIGAVLAATAQFWTQVEASDIPGRAAAFVDEIDRTRPHVVSLQEVFQFVVLDAAFSPIGGLDLLAAIEGEIAARGLPYEVAIEQAGTSSTLPLSPDPATGGIGRWLNFTDRVAVLKRTDVETLASAQGQYGAKYMLGPLTLARAWGRLTVDHEGVPHHVIATHLETQGLLPIHAAQADELENVIAAGLDGVTIISGDLNSDAAAGPGAPSWTPTYDQLTEAGFTDVWAIAPPNSEGDGFTCCHDPSLGEGRTPDERIDFILVRSADAVEQGRTMERGFFRAENFGDVGADRTPGGLWPSDHIGLLGSLRIPAPWP